MRAKAITITSTAAILLLAGPSSAAPDRSVTLSPTTRTASWNTGLSVGLDMVSAITPITLCGEAVFSCDETLIELTVPGNVTVEVTQTPIAQPYASFLVALHRSDAHGTKGVLLARDAYNSKLSITGPDLKAGFYLVEISWRQGGGDLDATATVVPAPIPRGPAGSGRGRVL